MADDYLKLSARRRRAMLDHALELHGWTCCICGGPIAEGDESLQHVKARSRGGTNDENNRRPAHKRCNSALGNREIDPSLIVYGGELLLIEWQQKLGR